jgi:hypothetical protein
MEEIWKDIEGYEGLYKVSNFGRVRSFARKGTKGKIRKGLKGNNGYLYIILYKKGIMKYYLAHRLVALTFLSNQYNKKQVNHKNGIKHCNNVNNLEFCTNSENNKHAYATNLRTKSHKSGIQPKKVIQFTKDGLYLIGNYISASEAERKTGIHQGNISHCCRLNKKYSHAGGYIWRYAA